MSGIYQSTRSIEATNQAMLLLGGLSAQSYRETGILKTASPGSRDGFSLDEVYSSNLTDSEFPAKDLAAPGKTLSGFAFNALSSAGTLLFAAGAQESADIQVPFNGNASPSFLADSDLSQQDPVFSDIAAGSVAVQASGEGGLPFSAVESVDSLSVLGLLELLTEELRNEASTNKPALDGANQEEARRQLGEGLRSVGEELGSNLGEVLGGRIQDQSNRLIDELGVEPVSNAVAPVSQIDFYDDSAAFLQSTFSTLGTASIPRIGPLLDDPQAELTRYFG